MGMMRILSGMLPHVRATGLKQSLIKNLKSSMIPPSRNLARNQTLKRNQNLQRNQNQQRNQKLKRNQHHTRKHLRNLQTPPPLKPSTKEILTVKERLSLNEYISEHPPDNQFDEYPIKIFTSNKGS